MATTATLLVAEFAVDFAVFIGTAGGLHDRARVGDVVIADALMQHDLDASPIFPRYEVPLYGVDRFPSDPQLSRALAEAARAVLDAALQGAGDAAGLDAELLLASGIDSSRVHVGLVVSGDRFVGNAAESGDRQAILGRSRCARVRAVAGEIRRGLKRAPQLLRTGEVVRGNRDYANRVAHAF